jgi:3-deoxy-D-arabino-heptulosonate 7-phosphate (DAHP) synthase
MIDDAETRDQIQYKVLKEIAQTQDVPQAVGRADRIARISRDNRDTIRDFLTAADYAHDYNWDGRWNDIEQAPDTQLQQ